jgi:MinD-like ATPase involved in chromosome partitioning or flagellar assembly
MAIFDSVFFGVSKGGVGKTTTISNAVFEFASDEKNRETKVIVIDTTILAGITNQLIGGDRLSQEAFLAATNQAGMDVVDVFTRLYHEPVGSLTIDDICVNVAAQRTDDIIPRNVYLLPGVDDPFRGIQNPTFEVAEKIAGHLVSLILSDRDKWVIVFDSDGDQMFGLGHVVGLLASRAVVPVLAADDAGMMGNLRHFTRSIIALRSGTYPGFQHSRSVPIATLRGIVWTKVQVRSNAACAALRSSFTPSQAVQDMLGDRNRELHTACQLHREMLTDPTIADLGFEAFVRRMTVVTQDFAGVGQESQRLCVPVPALSRVRTATKLDATKLANIMLDIKSVVALAFVLVLQQSPPPPPARHANGLRSLWE